MSTKDTSMSFKCSDDFRTMVSRDAADLDVSASEYIRACVMHSRGLFLTMPGMLLSVQALHAQDHRRGQEAGK